MLAFLWILHSEWGQTQSLCYSKDSEVTGSTTEESDQLRDQVWSEPGFTEHVPQEGGVWKCVKKVLDYVTMKNRLEGNVHPGLAAIGLERIEVGDDGLVFIGKKQD